MLTPVEIRGYQFKGKMGGYNKEDVDSFMSKVVADYETLYSDNQTLKETQIKLEFEISRYRKLEESMNQTLMVAQKAADDVRSQAAKEAELIVRQARQQVTDVISVYEDVVKRTEFMIAQVKGFLHAEMELLNSNEDRVKAFFKEWSSEDAEKLRADLKKTLEMNS